MPWKFQRSALEIFESVQEYGRIKLAPKDSPYGGYVLLSHYPYSGTGSDQRRRAVPPGAPPA